MGAMASQITSLTIVYPIVYPGAEQRKLRLTGLCAGNSPVTGEFPAQMASYAELFPFDDVFMSLRVQRQHPLPSTRPHILKQFASFQDDYRSTVWFCNLRLLFEYLMLIRLAQFV